MAAFGPRIAPHHPPQCHETAFDDTVLLHGLVTIFGTGRGEAAEAVRVKEPAHSVVE